MANGRRKDDRPELNEKLRQDPVSEDELDRLRAEGQSPEIGDGDSPATRVARSKGESGGLRGDASPEENPRRTAASEDRGDAHDFELGGKPSKSRASPGHESATEALRAEGHGMSESHRTQVEQDFGEQGRRLPDWADNSKAPSILDPNADGE